MINLQGLDLNLLRTLNVLLSENNVTRAAQRLNLSQPSVSVRSKLRSSPWRLIITIPAIEAIHFYYSVVDSTLQLSIAQR